MECFWCMSEYKANAEVLGDFCSPKLNTELPQKMNSNLTGCLDCVMAYHYARQYFLKRNESFQKELFSWEVNRLCEHMRNSLHPNKEIKLHVDEDPFDWQESKMFFGDDLLERLSVSLQEILNYPYLLWSKDVANLATEALLRLEQEGSPLVLHDKLPGVYLLIIHPNSQVRKWAKKCLQFLGSISCEDYDDLREAVKWIINVSEFDLLRSTNLEDINMLPAHLFLRNRVKEYWASVCTILKKIEPRTIRLQLLSRDNHSQFVTMLVTAIDSENCQNYGRDGEFWPLLNCLLILLKRLESRIWQYINIEKHADLFKLVVLHPAYLNEVKRLPGYNGKDVEICSTASSAQGLACRESQTQSQRLSDSLDTKSAESLRILMFGWCKLFLESVVAFGDTAKEVVKVIFKYFNCLRGELEIASEGYDIVMVAMIRCLEFLLKNSLQSFLNFAAKHWIPDLMEILKVDTAESLICQREAISFCKLFLKNRQEFHKDASSLITWIEEKSEKNVRSNLKNFCRLEELLFSHFRDLPPVPPRFERDKRTILLPSKKSGRKLQNSSLKSPLLDGKVCLKKLKVEKTTVSPSSSSDKSDDSPLCLKPSKPIKRSVPLKGLLKLKKIGKEKLVKTKQEPIVILDSSDDDEPLGQRYLRKRGGTEEEIPSECKRKCVESEKTVALDSKNEEVGAVNTSFPNIDNVTSLPDHNGQSGVGNKLDILEIDVTAMSNDDLNYGEVDIDDIIDDGISPESRKQRAASRSKSDEEICMSSDDEWMNTHVFSPGVSWQNKQESDGSPREETFATVISRIKSEVKDLPDVETLVAVKNEMESSQDEETVARVQRDMVDAVPNEEILSTVKHGVEDVANEEIFLTVKPGIKREVMDFQDEESFSNTRSRVKHKVEDVTSDEVLSTVRTQVEPNLMDCRDEETFPDARLRVKREAEHVTNEEILLGIEHAVMDFQDDETFCNATFIVQQELDRLPNEEIPSIWKLGVQNEVMDFQDDETFCNATFIVQQEVDRLPNEEILSIGKSGVQKEVMDFQDDETFCNATLIVQQEMDRLPNEEIPSIRKSGVQNGVMDFQDDETFCNAAFILQQEVDRLPNEEILSIGKSGVQKEVMDFQDEETVLIARSLVKHEMEDEPKDEILAAVGSRMKPDEVKDLKHEESVADAEPSATNELKDAAHKETITTERSLHEHEAKDLHVQHDKLRVGSNLKSLPNAETVTAAQSVDKHGAKDLLPKESIAKKRNDGAASSSSIGTLQSNTKTLRNIGNVDAVPKAKVAQVLPMKATLIKTVSAPVPVKPIPVTHKKPVETKPRKPLTMDELYHVILRWDPTMMMKNFTPDIRNCSQVKLIYETMDEYYSVFKPLLFLECWAQALREWQNKPRHHFSCVVKTIKEFVNNFLFVICHRRVCIKNNCDEKSLRENDLIIVKMKDEKLRPLFAIVESVKQERSSWKPGDEGNSDMQYFDLNITLRLIPKERGLLVHETIQCDVVTSLVTTLRQWRGMMYFPRSLLARDMLQPRIDKCCNNQFRTGKTAGEEVYNKSQAAAIDGTLAALRLPFPIPRISFIQGPPGTGKSHTIIGLVKSYLKSRETDLKAEKGNRLPGSKITPEQQALGKILLCAPSNTAVYVLIRRMIAEMKGWADENGGVKNRKNCGSINLVCVGRTSVLHPEVLPYALDTLAKVEVSSRSRNRLEHEKIVQRKVEATREKIEDLEKKGYHLRLAGFHDGSEEVKHINAEIDGMVKKKQRLEQDYRHIRGKIRMLKHEEEKIRKDVLLSADVICCTLNASGSALLHKLLKTASGQVPFGCVIVDEACQSCELDLLIPLQFGSSKLVMVGDPEQLRSTVLSKKAQELSLGQSMYERLYKVFKKRAHSSGRSLHTLEDNPIQLLDLQYRMHPEISLFPAKYVYQGRVKDERSLTTRKSVSSLKPYALLNVRNGTEQSSPCGSLCNPMESELVVEICWMLKKELSEERFGVITPYRAQVDLAQKRLRQRGLQYVEVGTVDGFQGREKDVVIMSCVRANDGHRKSIGFLADRTRLNVALTRAKYSLIILLNVDSLQTNLDWRACIDDARQRGVLYDVSSAKHLFQIFLKNDPRGKERLLNSGASPETQHASSRNNVLPSHAKVKNNKGDTSSTLNANVSKKKTCAANSLPSSASAQSGNATATDILPSHAKVKKDKHDISSTLNANVSKKKTCASNSLPSSAGAQSENASATDILPSNAKVKKDKADTSSTLNANVSKKKTCPSNILPSSASAKSENSTATDILPSNAKVKKDKHDISSTLNANVSKKKTCAANSLPSSAGAQSDNATATDILPSNAKVKNGKHDTSSTLNANVFNENKYTADMWPSSATAQSDNATATDMLFSHARVKNDKDETSCISANVSSEKTCTADMWPSSAGAQNDNATATDILPLHEANLNKSNEQISSSEEFDFDDHEPDIGSLHCNDETFSNGQDTNTDSNANRSLVSGELIDMIVNCGASIQAQLNPYMQQLVQHERVDKPIRN